MTYPFVQAFHDYGVRVRKPTLAFVVHMAEGGGTVGYLSRENPRGVSVHYVVEYSGRVVRMLAESHASGSINPNDLRAGDDPDGFYGISHAKTVLGSWWRDPNSVVLTCEVEGFAADGPNAKQAAALDALVDDIRSRYPDIGLLGHRDFTSRKACPGRRIDWAALGGHGAPTAPDTATEDTVTIVNCSRFEPRLFKTKAGLTKLRRFSETAELSPIAAPYSASVDAVCAISQSDDRVPHGEPFYRLATGGSAGFYVLGAQIDVAPEVDDTPYDEADLNLAKQAAAGAERLRWETWVGTRPK